MNITSDINQAAEKWLDGTCDWDFSGKPISRRQAGWTVDIVSFAAGYHAALSGEAPKVPELSDDELTALRERLFAGDVGASDFDLIVRLIDSASPQPAAREVRMLTEEEVDSIANDGCRNAAGGIYATRVQEFGVEVQRKCAEVWGLTLSAEPANKEQT
jgi:hypothetical protein